MKRTLFPLLLLVACGRGAAPIGAGDDTPTPDAPIAPDPDAPTAAGCPAAKAGAACVIALHDRAAASCDVADLAALREELELRRELGPLWADGRALFRTDAPRDIAGSFNNWQAGMARTTALCGAADLVVAIVPVATGAWQYKLVDTGTWTLDPHNPAFAYDDFGGNADGANSALVTPDAGVGQVIRLAQACSQTLGNCRDVTAYLPPGYDALANAQRTYPVLFAHDGQNLWDDHDCCFGHTGWEVNRTLDTEIAAGRVAPLVVIAAASTAARNDEYGLSPQKLDAFIAFQVTELQPAALAQVRWDQQRVGLVGSSLGGLVAVELALRHPTTYRFAAALSGAFWPGEDTNAQLLDRLPGYGKQPVAIYLDHGGNPANNSDGAADSIAVRDELVQLGWVRGDSPACATPGDNALCYFTEPGATHDELAWKARAWRFLRFGFAAN